MSIFDKRLAFKPFEYPEVVAYKEAVFFGGPHLAYIADQDCAAFQEVRRNQNLPPQCRASLMRNKGV